MKTTAKIVGKIGKAPKWALDVERLFRRAVRKAISQHFMAGNSILVREDGRILRISPK